MGILALTLELYESLRRTSARTCEQWLRSQVLEKLHLQADTEFRRAVYSKKSVEAEVRRLEQRKVDALIVVFLTYAPSQIVSPGIVRK